jgi:hypothetical protein
VSVRRASWPGSGFNWAKSPNDIQLPVTFEYQGDDYTGWGSEYDEDNPEMNIEGPDESFEDEEYEENIQEDD